MTYPTAGNLARDTLLSLSAGGASALDRADLARFSPGDWNWLGERAARYRMLPLLHSIFDARPDWPVPPALRNEGKAAYHAWAMRSLVMQQALIGIGELFDANGVRYAALKGASLSLEFYAEPALRPMRDLDIMVAPHDAERAYDLLRGSGYAKIPGYGEYGIEYKHHLPPLRNANAVPLELHHRIAPCDWSGSQPLADRLVANARRVDCSGVAISMAHPTDTLLHLVVHAAFQNLFDNGPNLLSDLGVLYHSGLADHREAQTFAARHGLAPSMALVDALFAAAAKEPAQHCYRGADVPRAMLDKAASLMTQDPDHLYQRHLLRKRRGLIRRLSDGVARALRPNEYDLSEIAGKDVRGIVALRYYPAWLYHKSRVYLGAAFSGDLDREAAGDIALEEWIGRPALGERDVKA